MPAPTAPVRSLDEVMEAVDVPLPQSRKYRIAGTVSRRQLQLTDGPLHSLEDDDLLIDPTAMTKALPETLVPAQSDTNMHIDEEGRPKFAPSKDTVRFLATKSKVRVSDD